LRVLLERLLLDFREIVQEAHEEEGVITGTCRGLSLPLIYFLYNSASCVGTVIGERTPNLDGAMTGMLVPTYPRILAVTSAGNLAAPSVVETIGRDPRTSCS
jgi:hypothetical protein